MLGFRHTVLPGNIINSLLQYIVHIYVYINKFMIPCQFCCNNYIPMLGRVLERVVGVDNPCSLEYIVYWNYVGSCSFRAMGIKVFRRPVRRTKWNNNGTCTYVRTCLFVVICFIIANVARI